jgi:hypothetical protein
MRLVLLIMIPAILGSLYAQEVYLDEEGTPPPLTDEVPLAKKNENDQVENSKNSVQKSATRKENKIENTPAVTNDDKSAEVSDDLVVDDQGSKSELMNPNNKTFEREQKNYSGNSLYDEMEENFKNEMGEARPIDISGENTDNETSTQNEKIVKKKNLKSKNSKQNITTQKDNENDEQALWQIGMNAQYSNQLSHDQSHGFGLGANFLYSLNERWKLGAGIFWDRFSESEESNTATIDRVAHHYLMGPLLRANWINGFSTDALIGWDHMRTQFNIADKNTGASLNSLLGTSAGKYTESAVGMLLRANYGWNLAEEFWCDLYLAYELGFYSGENLSSSKKARKPQQISVGALIMFGSL